jgi:hypothetical protein
MQIVNSIHNVLNCINKNRKHSNIPFHFEWLGLLCLTPLSIVCQLYRRGQFNWRIKPGYLEKTTNLPQVVDNLYHIMVYRAYLALAGFELTTSVMIGSYKSSYHTVMITTAFFCSFWLPINHLFTWKNVKV